MSTKAHALARRTELPPRPDLSGGTDWTIDLADIEAAAPDADSSCWRLLTSRVPLTLLLDLALPTQRLADLAVELLEEEPTADWLTSGCA